MIALLPQELVLRICQFLDPVQWNKLYPDWVFRPPNRALISLSQTSTAVRKMVLPIIIRYTSLVRKHEIDRIDGHQFIDGIASHRLMLISGCEAFVEHLEVHSNTLTLVNFSLFTKIQSLTILGPIHSSSIVNPILIQLPALKHLALSLPKDGSPLLQPPRLTRLDLIFESGKCLDSLGQFDTYNTIMELNVCARDTNTILLLQKFHHFLDTLKLLDRLSITKRSSPKGLLYNKPEQAEPAPLESLSNFFEVISRLNLTSLSIDFVLFRDYEQIMSQFDAQGMIQRLSNKPELDLEFVEPALVGLLSTSQQQTIIKFMDTLSVTYSIRSLKLVFGLQTEILPSLSVLVLRNLLISSHSTDSEGASSVKEISTMMAWNVREDTQFLEDQRADPSNALSGFESDISYSPFYKRLLKYKVERSERGNISIKDDFCVDSIVDYDFWSRQSIAVDLLNFCDEPRKKSWIWD